MKRTTLLLLLVCGLVMTGCGKDEKPAETTDETAQASSGDAAATAQNTEKAKSDQAAQELEDIQNQALGEDKPAEKPAAKPAEKTTADKAAEAVKDAAKEAAETGDTDKAAEDLKAKATEEAKKAADKAKEEAPQPTTQPAKDASTGKAIPGPWHDAKKGTKVRLKGMGGMQTVYEVVEADPEKVTIKMTMMTGDNQPLGDPQTMVQPRSVKPDSPEAKKHQEYMANKKGTEAVVVGGKSYECDVYEIENKVAGKTIVTRQYMCKEIPGWIVKVEGNPTGEMQVLQELVEFQP